MCVIIRESEAENKTCSQCGEKILLIQNTYTSQFFLICKICGYRIPVMILDDIRYEENKKGLEFILQEK